MKQVFHVTITMENEGDRETLRDTLLDKQIKMFKGQVDGVHTVHVETDWEFQRHKRITRYLVFAGRVQYQGEGPDGGWGEFVAGFASATEAVAHAKEKSPSGMEWAEVVDLYRGLVVWSRYKDGKAIEPSEDNEVEIK